MMTRSRVTHCLWAISCAALAAGCSGGATPTSPSGTSTPASSSVTRGRAHDPSNDAARIPGVAVSPEPLSVDVVVDYAASGYNPRRADVFACATNDPSGCRSVPTPSVDLTSERIEWRFPTSALQDADGLMRVKVVAFVGDFPGETSADADVAPDHGLPAILIR